MNDGRLKYPLPEILILLVATVSRFWRLDYHSFWFDEAVSLKWAGAYPFNTGLDYTIPTTFQLVEEKHPPVYYTLLYFWREGLSLVGWEQSDIALRSLGALLGVVTVLGVILLTKQICGRPVALLTGLLVALSPVLIWYSQELRMFQPAVTFIVWAFYGLVMAWQARSIWPRWLWWLLTLLCFELALYSYLFSAFMLPGAGLALLLWFLWGERRPRAWQKFAEGVLTFLLIGLLFLPLARNAWLVNGNESTPGYLFGHFWETIRHQFKIATIWREKWPDPLDDVALCILAFLFLMGLLWPFIRLFNQWLLSNKIGDSAFSNHQHGHHHLSNTANDQRDVFIDWLNNRQRAILLVVWIGVPLLLGNLLLASNDAVFKEDRYHIYLVPFVLWAIAFGCHHLTRIRLWLGWTAGTVSILALLLVLPRFWTPSLLREDWRSAAQYIHHYQQLSPELPSASVTHINYTHLAMDWYLQPHYAFEDFPIFGLFGDPLTSNMIDDVIAPPLMGIVEYGSHTLWLTQSHLEGVDDDRIVEGWLRHTFPVVTEQYPTGVKVTGFALQSFYNEVPQLSGNIEYPQVELAPGLTLAACEVMTPNVRSLDERLHPPNGWVHLRLWWHVTGKIPSNYEATAHVINATGIWGKRLEREGEMVSHLPTSGWPLDQIVRDEFDVNLNPLIPSGEYLVVVGMKNVDKQTPSTETQSSETQSSETPCGTVLVTQ